MSESHKKIDWQAIRQRLASESDDSGGMQMWRSLQELAGDEDFRHQLQREFAAGAERMTDPITRRRFLQLAAASLGLAGLTACVGEPAERVLPYVREPANAGAGEARFFTTAHLIGGYAEGLLAESHVGRPTRVTGNEQHPASLGASDAFAQASILSLYDPERAREPRREGEAASWSQFFEEMRAVLEQNGTVRLLTPTITSPTLIDQIEQLLDAYPRARWQQYEPVNWDNAYEGARLAFGRPLQAVYDFQQADVILSLDADFLFTFPGRLRYARDFSERRLVTTAPEEGQPPAMNRLYSVSPTPTITTSMADHHWPLRPQAIALFAHLVARELGLQVAELPGSLTGAISAELQAAAAAVAADLRANAGRSLVLAGLAQPPVVHALAQAMNVALDNVGSTVSYIEPVPALVDDQLGRLREPVQEMEAGDVDALLIFGGNPAYTAPQGVDFAGALLQVPFSVHHTDYVNETSALCRWRLPDTHYLETWSDARAFDGTATIMQPLIQPLFDGRSPHALLATILAQDVREPLEIIRAHWRRVWQNRESAPEADGDAGAAFEAFWRQSLFEGVVPGTSFEPQEVTLDAGFEPGAVSETAGLPSQPDDGRFLAILRPDASLWDGRFAHNAWLQELPRPFTKITWGNAALVGPALAEQLDLDHGDVVRLQMAAVEGGEPAVLQAPVFVLPGQAEGCITLHVGYGREVAATLAQQVGFDAYAVHGGDVRTGRALWSAVIEQIEATGEEIRLATTQNHHTMEGRDLVRVGSLDEFRQDPTFGHELPEELPSLYPEFEYDGYAWGMSVNLNTCIGCQACVVACQAENNIPVVGREGVLQGREMHWLRVDDYFAGDDVEDARIFHQPVPCMHCELAPCEPVCPVSATTHSAEGLNEMTYNRCIGTRYCSNNCPYKVRRFNFFDYSSSDELISLLYNPDVTVRERGVMEKCTYCVQRINAARSVAQREERTIRDGELQTACQEACPANAIVFGDVNDPGTQVAQRKALPHDYTLLAELGTRPRTTYLAKLINLNEEIE